MTRRQALWQRELLLRWRAGGWAIGVGVFAALGALAPLALGGEAALLRTAGPGLLWVILGLSVFLGTEGLFEDDLRSGVIEQFVLSPTALSEVMLVKLTVAWAFFTVPALLVMPILLLGYGAGLASWGALLLASPGLVFTAGTVAALAAGQRRGAPLLVFLALPLIVPALVFGPGAAQGGAVPFLALAAYSLQAIAVCPFITAAGMRLQLT